MSNSVYKSISEAVDLLIPLQIVAWLLGSELLKGKIEATPHPRRDNVASRAPYATDYKYLLWDQILRELPGRDPAKTEAHHAIWPAISIRPCSNLEVDLAPNCTRPVLT